MRVVRAIAVLTGMIVGGIGAALLIPRGLKQAFIWIRGKDIEVPPFDAPFAVAGHTVFGAITLGLLTFTVVVWLERAWARYQAMSLREKFTLAASVVIGLVLSIPFQMLFFYFGPAAMFGGLVLAIVLMGLTYVMLSGVAEAIPLPKAHVRGGARIKILDTSVLIDGRVYDVAKCGFIEGKLYVPSFVLRELQLVADSHEANKRQRGRRGLDILKNLQGDFEVEIGTQDVHAGSPRDPVDIRLVTLAKTLGATIVTNDFNLNKLAQVHNVRVLNINDLAMAVRPQYLPMDELEVNITREGSQPGQGVGYLEDGTMVVVENAQTLIGMRIKVRITQVHQSAAGRMLFAVPCEGEEPERLKKTKPL
jgi:uncharacterized protein YacL